MPRTRAALAALIAAAILGACSGSDDIKATPAPPSDRPTHTATPTTAPTTSAPTPTLGTVDATTPDVGTMPTGFTFDGETDVRPDFNAIQMCPHVAADYPALTHRTASRFRNFRSEAGESGDSRGALITDSEQSAKDLMTSIKTAASRCVTNPAKQSDGTVTTKILDAAGAWDEAIAVWNETVSDAPAGYGTVRLVVRKGANVAGYASFTMYAKPITKGDLPSSNEKETVLALLAMLG